MGYRERDLRSGFDLPGLGNFRDAAPSHRPLLKVDPEASRGAARRDQPHVGRHRGDPVMVAAAARAQGHPDRRGRPAGRRARRRRRRREQPWSPPAGSGPGLDRRARRGRRGGRRPGRGVGRRRRAARPRHRDRARPRARGVLVGRPILWALAADGQAGVERALAILGEELRVALALLGTPTPADIGPEHLAG